MDKVALKYDKSKPESIEHYAVNLEGHTFNEVLDWNLHPEFSKEKYSDPKRKGGLGNLLEEHYFGYKGNSNQEADFPEAGVELKVTPYVVTQKGLKRAKERVVITMISYDEPVEPNFYKSHVWNKTKLTLLIYYLHDYSVEDKQDFQIKYVRMFTPPEADQKIIVQDYKKIITKVAEGNAELLSEADTMYLGACTKGSTKAASTVPQTYYAPHKNAMKRAFCFKSKYMTYVLNNYVDNVEDNSERIIRSDEELDSETFEDIVIKKANSFIGKTDKEIAKLLKIPYKNNKATWNTLAFRMLGVRSNKTEEFQKAGIIVKTIRLNSNNKIRESMSLPIVSFKKLAEESWDESALREYLETSKFFFVIYKQAKNGYILKGSQFWNIPMNDLDNTAKAEWTAYRDIIKNGVDFTLPNREDNYVRNNLPNKSDTKIIHMRPHANKSFYKFKNGEVYGSGSIKDADELPDGNYMTKQSFWLNNDYILSQLDKKLLR